MTQFTMIRQVGKLVLKADGFEFGSLVDCEVCWLFQTDDDKLMSMVDLAGDMSVIEMLAVIKEAYINYEADCAGEAAFEKSCEQSYWNKVEYNAEHQAEMAMQDMM